MKRPTDQRSDAEVAADEQNQPPPSLLGSVEFLVSDEELIEPLYEDWEPDPGGW